MEEGSSRQSVDEPDKMDLLNSMLCTITLIEEDGKLPNNFWLFTVLAHI